MSRAILTTKKDQWERYSVGIGGKCKGCGVHIANREVHYRSANWVICPTCYLTIPDRAAKSSTSDIPGHREGEQIATQFKFWIGFIIVAVIVIGKCFAYLKDLIFG